MISVTSDTSTENIVASVRRCSKKDNDPNWVRTFTETLEYYFKLKLIVDHVQFKVFICYSYETENKASFERIL